MKNRLTKALAILIATFIAIAAIPLDGFAKIDFKPFAFSVFANAEEAEDELSENQVDYSDITPNEYMTRVLLNENYVGTANRYGAKSSTIHGDQLRWFLNTSNVSVAKPLYTSLNNSPLFVYSVSTWKALTFDPSVAYENLLDMEGYYEAILMSILDKKVNSDEFLDAMNSSANKTIMSISKSSLKILEKLKDIDISQLNLKQLTLSDFTEEEFKEVYAYLFEMRETKNLYKQAGDYLADGQMVLKTCTTFYDVVSTIGKYSQLADFSETVKNVLYRIYLNCPETNQPMKSACKKVYEAASEQLDNASIAFIETGEAFISNTFSFVIGKIWNWAKDAIITTLGSSLLVGMNLGLVIGKAITNFTFSTDAVIEQFFAIECLLKFEDLMVSVVNSFALDYKQNGSTENANNYIKSIEMLFATRNLDYEYTYSFVVTAKEKGAYNTVKSWISGKDETVESYRKSIESMYSSIKFMQHTLTDLEGYRAYYEDDAPSAYSAYFNTHYSVPEPYSKTDPVICVSPVFDIERSNYMLLEYRLETDKTVTVIKCHPASSGTVEIPKDYGGYAIRKIGKSAFENCNDIECVVMNDTLEIIEEGAFRNCANLSSVNLNNGLQTIGNEAFAGTKLVTVTIPKTVTFLGQYSTNSYALFRYPAFYNINTLRTVIFEEGRTHIPNEALYKCETVTSVVIPEGVTTIGTRAFFGCSALTTIELPQSLKTIQSAAFSSAGLTEIQLNEGLEYIGYEAFYATKLVTVTIPKTVTFLGQYSTNSYALFRYPAFYNIDTLRTVIFEEGRTTIPSYALCKCRTVTNVVIPEGVTTIGTRAFFGCSALTTIELPQSLKTIQSAAFSSAGLTEIQLNEGLEYIGNEAFYATKLVTVTIPKTVTFLGQYSTNSYALFRYPAFYNIDTLRTVIFEEGRTTIPSDALYECRTVTNVVIPEGVTTICTRAFRGCSALTTIELPQSLKTIQSAAFSSAGLTEIQLNEGLEYIGDEAFYATKLVTVTIPKTVTTLGKYTSDPNVTFRHPAFYNIDTLRTVIFEEGRTTIPSDALYECRTVTNVVIPEGVTTIGTRAFRGCSALTTIELPQSLKTIQSAAFSSAGLTEIQLNEGLEYIGDEAFYATKLVTVTIPKTVTTLGKYTSDPNVTFRYPAFYNINTLRTVIFEEGRTTIPSDALYECKTVTNVVIPQGVTSIGTRAFRGCASLTEFIFPADVTSIGNEAFYNCTNLKKVYAVKNTAGYKFAQDNGLEIVEIACTHPTTKLIVDVVKSCTVDGVSRNVCTVCEQTVSTITDPAEGHNYSSEYVLIPATCTSEGLKKMICSKCGDAKEAVIEKLPHTYDDANDTVCNVCGAQGHSHSYTSAVTKEATHLTVGEMTFTCSCGHSYTEEIAKTQAHSYTATVTAPTCTQRGYTTYVCACGDEYTADHVDATGHTYTSKITKAATHTATGVKTFTCKCGETYTEVIAKTATHTYKPTVTPPTLISQGYTTYRCECGHSYIADYTDKIKNDNVIATETGSLIGLAGVSMQTLLTQVANAKAYDAQGNAKAADAKIGTGDKLVLADGTELIVSVLGDLNGDGEVATSDARLALRKAVDLETFDDAHILAANVDNNEEVGVADARKILRASVDLDKTSDWFAKIAVQSN